MQNGDKVRVYPHGMPELGAVGKLLIISPNQFSICVGFMEKPPFVNIGNGMAVHPEEGIVLLLVRDDTGMYVELFDNSHYEVEPA